MWLCSLPIRQLFLDPDADQCRQSDAHLLGFSLQARSAALRRIVIGESFFCSGFLDAEIGELF
jgi:hypothetical protein